MLRRTRRLVWIPILLLFGAGLLFATDVLLPGDNPPERLVQVRRLAMRAIAASVGDLNAKINSADIIPAAADAQAIAALATFLPVALAEAPPQDPPADGSRYFFRGGPIGEIREIASTLNLAAEELADQARAGNRTAVEDRLLQVMAACGSCHGRFRGQR